MKGYLLHGENTQASRQKLNEIKGEFDPAAIELSSAEAGLPLQNQIFTQPKLTIFEIFEKDKLRRFEPENFFKQLAAAEKHLTAVLWFGFELPVSNKIISSARSLGLKELKFSVSPLVFKLADAFFAPAGSKIFYQIITNLDPSGGEDVFLVQMLIRSTRLKLWACLKNNSYRKLNPFAKKQVGLNARLNREKLLYLFEKLVDLEKKVKSGPNDLASSLLLLYESF